MDEPIRVLIADDHAVVRYGLRALLTSEPSLEVIGEAADGVSAVAQAHALQPDVLLLDLLMPGKEGVQVIEELMRTAPGVRILVLTSFVDDEHLFPALRAGAYGYLLKESAPAELIQGIRDVAAGKSPLDPVIARRVLQELTQPSAPPAAEALTERETDVLGLVAQGLSNKAIAAELHLSERTVRSHVSNILAKLHLSSRTEAALHALRTGLAQLEGGTS
ncbi:MAG TPA: response regulator transcription factor [Chloroflexota bacterium]|nr:response regulator transcription factor [Chloroflexota bacterium]